MSNSNHHVKYQLHDNTVEVVCVSNINDWVVIKPHIDNGKSIMVLLINEIPIKNEEIEKMAKEMIKSGLTLFSSRGVDANTIEQIVDNVCVLNFLNSNDEKDLDLPTTSHNNESLENALNLFAHAWLTYDHHHRFVIICSKDKKTFREIKEDFKKQEIKTKNKCPGNKRI